MAHGKWITKSAGDKPVSCVAREVLQVRFRDLKRLVKAVAKSPADVKPVHDLRVACRRMQAALILFRPLLPNRRRRQMVREIKKLRAAAGDARDLDVLAKRLRKAVNGNGNSPLSQVLTDIRRRRKATYADLEVIWKKFKKRDISQKEKRLESSLRWREESTEPTFRSFANEALGDRVAEFFAVGDSGLATSQQLHDLRIAGKKLRYAIELLSSAFDSRLRSEVYPVFSNLQEELGGLNDHFVARSLYEQWLMQSEDTALSRELAHLVQLEQDAIDEGSRTFRKTWQSNLRSDLQDRFDDLLLNRANNGKTARAFQNA